MNKSSIVIFAGKFLEKKEYITPKALQRYIREQPEVATAIPVEVIKEALDFLVFAGFLVVAKGDHEVQVYKRYNPELHIHSPHTQFKENPCTTTQVQ